jgi:hypothetical protein
MPALMISFSPTEKKFQLIDEVTEHIIGQEPWLFLLVLHVKTWNNEFERKRLCIMHATIEALQTIMSLRDQSIKIQDIEIRNPCILTLQFQQTRTM